MRSPGHSADERPSARYPEECRHLTQLCSVFMPRSPPPELERVSVLETGGRILLMKALLTCLLSCLLSSMAKCQHKRVPGLLASTSLGHISGKSLLTSCLPGQEWYSDRLVPLWHHIKEGTQAQRRTETCLNLHSRAQWQRIAEERTWALKQTAPVPIPDLLLTCFVTLGQSLLSGLSRHICEMRQMDRQMILSSASLS